MRVRHYFYLFPHVFLEIAVHPINYPNLNFHARWHFPSFYQLGMSRLITY